LDFALLKPGINSNAIAMNELEKEKILSFISAQSTNLIGGENKTWDFV